MADDVLAVLDQLGLERVKLVGHDWGGWIGFLLGLRAPDRFSRFLVLNVAHPWGEPAELRAPPLALLVPVADPHAGHRLPAPPQRKVRAEDPGRRLHGRRRPGTRRRSRSFADSFTAPDHARAAVQVYRVFNLREFGPIAAGRYEAERLTVPTLMLFGKTTSSSARRMLAGYQHHADQMRVELVPGCGHFIVDERPELVAERAREFLA